MPTRHIPSLGVLLTLAALSLTACSPSTAPPAGPRATPDTVASTTPPPAPVPEPPSPPADAAPPPQATPAAAVTAAPPAAPGTFALGAPTATTATELVTKRWAQDGGGEETVKPADGSTFVVLSFPEATKVTFAANDFSLRAGDGPPLAPYAVTSPSANPIQPRSSDPGPARFQREVFMFVDWEPGPNTPFAVAFEVPSATRSGFLRIKDVENPVSW